MESIACIQGQGEGSRGPPILVPISEEIPQDILESFEVQEGQEDLQGLHLAPMEDCPVVEMEGDMEVVEAEFECRD